MKNMSIQSYIFLQVAREIDFHRSSACPTGGSFGEDRFLPVMQDFHAQASATFAELEDQFQVKI